MLKTERDVFGVVPGQTYKIINIPYRCVDSLRILERQAL